MIDLGDGHRGEIEAMALYADVLRAERDEAQARADSYIDLIHAAVRHHLTDHADCEGYR